MRSQGVILLGAQQQASLVSPKAAQIQADEKLLLQPSFRAPMLAKIPYPPWALKKEDVDAAAGDGEPVDGPRAAVTGKKSRREADFA